MAGELRVRDLRVSVEGKPILRGVDLTVRAGEIHALMGPNGSGKSTLSHAIVGHPGYKIESGSVSLNGENLLDLPADARARLGLFLAFQYPVAIPGVTVANFLRSALAAQRGGAPVPPREFKRLLAENLDLLGIQEAFASRYLNDGFSGGEKKRLEIMQMAVLRPRFAILDEPDSGLDIDAVRTVAEGVNALAGPELGVLIITHYQRILDYVRPDFVHVLLDGRVVRSGGQELVRELEERGYDWLREEAASGTGS
ncbi:MAG: Fe-S cluster assembly ATPase SufC [Chloroflexi bacterium]|nr:Fe-S cluster assembly ATPase SufC [Chloroflexota bacterium]